MKKRHAAGKQKCNEGLIPKEIMKLLKSGSLPRRGKKAAAGLADAAAGKRQATLAGRLQFVPVLSRTNNVVRVRLI
jgi:hypothetical protein